MNADDQHGRRYELSPEGALSVMPRTDSEHAVIASRLLAWFARAGWAAEQILLGAGIRIPGDEHSGGRIPDLTVWARPQSPSNWLELTDVVLAIEIISPASRPTDEMIKLREYAAAGIVRYWTVNDDPAQTATLHTLGPSRNYEVGAKLPLGWLLQTEPTDHQLGG
jgi:Uma2 family endonuclease